MHRELEWPVSKAACLYTHLYMLYIQPYKIIEGTKRKSVESPIGGAAFVVYSEPHTRARPSVFLCAGLIT
jgi:hypothetical protein